MKDQTLAFFTRERRARFLDFSGWFLFFAWIILTYLFKPFREGIGTMGVGVIVFVVAALRRITSRNTSWNWLAVGVLFILAGACILAGIDLPILGITLVLCGLLMMSSRRHRE
jgi:hypothetical protein